MTFIDVIAFCAHQLSTPVGDFLEMDLDLIMKFAEAAQRLTPKE